MQKAGFTGRENSSLAEIARLRRFTGAPAEFWPAFLSAASGLLGASRGILILKDHRPDGTWKKLSEWSHNGQPDKLALSFNRQLIELGEAVQKDGTALVPLEAPTAAEARNFAAGVRLVLNRPEETCVGAFLIADADERQAHEALVRLQLVADTPSAYLQSHTAGQARTDVEKFAASLDVMTLLNAEQKFLGAALAMCNAVATRYGCDRVSLGWIEKGYIQVKTISRTERFDRHMAAVKALELTMEECFDQDDEIVYPTPDGTTFVNRDHEKFAKENSVAHLCSIPIRVDRSGVAVLTCERQSKPFAAAELQQLRLACDQAARRLSDLKDRDGWIGARAVRGFRRQSAKLLGPEHTWAKVLAILGALALIVLIFGRFNYRVEGNFLLKSDAVAYLTAPFDGFIKEVHVKPGDLLASSNILMQLDTDDLSLQEAEALAEQVRYQREAEKARATNGLAEMRIALSLAEQSKARLDLMRHRIQQSSIRAPFDGILVEGDLRERLSAPVKQGDALFKLTKLQGMYVEAEINQRDVHELKTGAEGEIAFVTQPKLKYRIKVDRVYPAAFPKEGENLFIVRCQVLDAPADWWRPGMSGLVKIEAGRRSLFWILTHRTIDFLRLYLWW